MKGSVMKDIDEKWVADTFEAAQAAQTPRPERAIDSPTQQGHHLVAVQLLRGIHENNPSFDCPTCRIAHPSPSCANEVASGRRNTTTATTQQASPRHRASLLKHA